LRKIIKKRTNSLFRIVSKKSDGSVTISNGSRSLQIDGGGTTIALKKNRRPKALIKAKSVVTEGKVVICLPLVTISEANRSEHWSKSNERHQLQKRIVASILNPVKDRIKLPCHIKLTRLAPRKLDKTDNLPTSMKYVIDACCAIITGDFRPGRADDDKRITISCDQKSSKEYGVEVEFTF
jgi:hypothetical protein